MKNNKLNSGVKNKQSGGFPLVEFALAAALATGAGYMYVTHKEEIDKEARKKIDKLAKLYKQSRPEVEKRVKKVWGEVSKNAISTYMDLRASLLHELEAENLKRRGDVLKKHYDQIVEGVIKSARKSGILTKETEDKLAGMFKLDWKELEKNLMNAAIIGAQKAAVAIKNIRNNQKAKTVKKRLLKAAKRGVGKKNAGNKKSKKK